MIQVLHAARFLELVAEGRWEFVRRRNASAVVGIIAVTPVGGPVIELPAGLVGDEQSDEDTLTAAGRELEEETGWLPASCRVLTRGPSSEGTGVGSGCVLNVVAWTILDGTWWPGFLAMQTPLTANLIATEVRAARYHGIWARLLNPHLDDSVELHR